MWRSTHRRQRLPAAATLPTASALSRCCAVCHHRGGPEGTGTGPGSPAEEVPQRHQTPADQPVRCGGGGGGGGGGDLEQQEQAAASPGARLAGSACLPTWPCLPACCSPCHATLRSGQSQVPRHAARFAAPRLQVCLGRRQPAGPRLRPRRRHLEVDRRRDHHCQGHRPVARGD